jgi:hypothetical protein
MPFSIIPNPARPATLQADLTGAAPDLLEALEELLTSMRISGPYSSIEKARKAIARAKGIAPRRF